MHPALERIAGKRVLVIGDVMLDHYVWGDVNRISPEAPVPVVRVTRENDMPGAAANVAVNLAALDACPVMFSIIGNDREGRRLRELLEQKHVDCRFLVADDKLATTRKVRIIARSQHVVRVDWDGMLAYEAVERSGLQLKFEQSLAECDAVIVQDYNKGLVTQAFFDMIREARVPVIVDPNRYHSVRYAGTVVTPNLEEARIVSGVSCESEEALQRLPEIAAGIFARHAVEHAVITLGEHGIALCERTGEIRTCPVAQTHEVYDVSGAGDTVAAVLGGMLAGKADLWTACLIANAAGSIVVGKMGTATTTRSEIQHLLDANDLSLPAELSQ